MTVTDGSCLSRDVADDKWPPGFRFHPTDEELILYYLKRKICKRRLRLDIIRVLDVYKWDPEELPGQSILKTGDRQWFFFSPRDRKYPNGGRSNRATRHGYWKATGKDRNVTCNSRNVGVKKTLVFYRGRAPNGERTDWVMHEYTLDEEELKRCTNAQDYYALYKVYKKSGPGPKNGEQYGAPFKEEHWLDGECAPKVNSVAPVKQQNVVSPSVDNARAIAQVELPAELEDIIRQIGDGNLFDFPEIADCTNELHRVAGEEETQSTLVDPSFREAFFTESVLPTSSPQCEKQASSDFQSATSKNVQLFDAPGPKPILGNFERSLPICEDDFLEIDDLMGPEPTIQNSEIAKDNFGLCDFDGLGELDLYHDAALFWNDMGPVGQETVSHAHDLGFGLQPHSLANQDNYPVQSHSSVSGVDYLPPDSIINDVNYLQPREYGADQLWSHDQGTVTQPTGVKHESANNFTGANQNQSGEEDDVGGWFSSTLWSFVESIPTTPASASEMPLVNKAFERMSSFSRIRMMSNINSNIVNAPSSAVNARKADGISRIFFFLSIFGALCAILWVLVGSGRVFGRSISS